jgi:hypothetical protein
MATICKAVSFAMAGPAAIKAAKQTDAANLRVME